MWERGTKHITLSPIGYGILLNERYQFSMDMALVRAKLNTKRQLFVDNHMIAHMQGVLRETHATTDHPDNPIFAPYVLYPEYISPEHGWRLYYNSNGILLHGAYSRDGIEWQIPDPNAYDIDKAPQDSVPAGPNNVVAYSQAQGLFFEPDDPDPQRRWKLILIPSQSRPGAASSSVEVSRPARRAGPCSVSRGAASDSSHGRGPVVLEEILIQEPRRGD